jgi:hypothetical protein
LATALVAASGGELDIPPGTYLVSTFAPSANTVVKGAGIGVTTIKRLAAASSSNGSPLVVVPSGGAIENLTVDLNNPAYGNLMSGVGPNGSTTNSALRHLLIVNAGFNGLHWDNNIGTWSHSGTMIDDVTATGSAWIGAVLKGISNGHASAISVTSSGYDAIELDYNKQFELIAARADKSVPPRLFFAGAGNPLVTSSATTNTVTNSASLAFTVGSGLNYNPGQYVCAYYATIPSNYTCGTISSYSGTNLALQASASGGSGTWANWTIVAEGGMLIWRGLNNNNIVISSPIVNDNRHAANDGIGIGENGTTSSTSITPGAASKTFVLPASNLAYAAGQNVTIISRANPTATWMRGVVTSYSGTSLTVNVTSALGSGAHTDWTLNTEPGNEVITGAIVTYAGLFGIDLASNSILNGALIYQPAERGLEFGLDLGGRVSGVSASNVIIKNSNGQGVFFGNHNNFQSFEDINLSSIQVFDERATKQTRYGVEVDTTNTSFTGVFLDNSSSYYYNILEKRYFVFGSGIDPRLDGAWLNYPAMLNWTGGTPTGATVNAQYDDHGSGKTHPIQFQIYTGSALNGATALSVTMPYAIAAGVGCALYGVDAGTGAVVNGFVTAGGSSMVVTPSAGFAAGHYYSLSGSCQSN